jgi:Cu/Zn superoxide dismutase
VLVVGANGEATLPVLAPQLRVKDVRGRSLMIHAVGTTIPTSRSP